MFDSLRIWIKFALAITVALTAARAHSQNFQALDTAALLNKAEHAYASATDELERAKLQFQLAASQQMHWFVTGTSSTLTLSLKKNSTSRKSVGTLIAEAAREALGDDEFALRQQRIAANLLGTLEKLHRLDVPHEERVQMSGPPPILHTMGMTSASRAALKQNAAEVEAYAKETRRLAKLNSAVSLWNQAADLLIETSLSAERLEQLMKEASASDEVKNFVRMRVRAKSIKELPNSLQK